MRRTPLSGYCDACDWAMQGDDLHPGIDPRTAVLIGSVEHARSTARPEGDFAGRLRHVLAAAACVVAAHDPVLADRMVASARLRGDSVPVDDEREESDDDRQ